MLAVVDDEEAAPEPEPTDQSMPEGTAYMGELAPDAPATGQLDDEIYVDVYSFEGQAGQMVTITMVGEGGLDAYLGLMDPADEVIAEDDDSAGGTDAQIAIELPDSGEYLILATRVGLDAGTTSGGYTLTISEGAPEPEEEAPATGLSGFGGLPGRSLESESGTVYLRGFGASDDAAKNTPVENFLSSQEGLPGRGGRGAGLRPSPSLSLNFEEIKIT